MVSEKKSSPIKFKRLKLVIKIPDFFFFFLTYTIVSVKNWNWYLVSFSFLMTLRSMILNKLWSIFKIITEIQYIIPVIIVLRDSAVNSIKMIAGSKGKVVAAIKSGKIKTTFLMVGIVLTLCYNLPFELFNLDIADFLLVLATIFSIISGVQYYVMNKDLIFTKEEKKEK